MVMMSRMCTAVAVAAAAAAGSPDDRSGVCSDGVCIDEVSMLQMKGSLEDGPDRPPLTLPLPVPNYNNTDDLDVDEKAGVKLCNGRDCDNPELCGLGFEVYPYIQPELWGNSYDGWHTCDGRSQSPIDFKNHETPGNHKLKEQYCAGRGLRQWNDGHSLRVRGLFGNLHVDCCDVPSVQFHMHTPSEHTINNRSFAMELQIVHEGVKSAVTGILFKLGKKNRCLEKYFEAPAPRAGCDRYIGDINLGCFFRDKTAKYYQYSGSLTTPPCTENVEWYVLQKPFEISRQQLEVFKTRFVMNARPTQPRNHRPVYLNDPSNHAEED